MLKVIYRYVRVTLKGPKKQYIENKPKAAEIIEERIKYFNQFYQYKFNKIAIKNNKTRWGSCSKAGNLNFHYKVASLPPELRDYVIIHELCHLKHFNHSRSFWNEVERILPEYEKLRLSLREMIY